jgi:hypothetical protein
LDKLEKTAWRTWVRSPKRFRVIAAGRRSYKTETAKRILLIGDKHHRGAFSTPGGRFFYTCPTRDQAKHNAWEDLKKLTKSRQTRTPSESELIIWVRADGGGEAEICLIGLDKPARIEGRMWHGGIMDECADMKAGVWGQHVQPVTADTGAWVIFIGVPDFAGPGGKDFKEQFDKGLNPDVAEWDSHTWFSDAVLPADVIEEAKTTLSPALYRQEYEASFETAPGRAYSEFAKTLHVKTAPYRPDLPTLVGCDFNSGHHNWGMYQYDAATTTYRAFDEVYLQSATVEGMCVALKDRCRVHGINEASLQFFGDYSGTAHKAEATWSAWEQIKAAFPACGYHYQLQGPIADRINLVNAYLRNAAGQVRTVIDPRCRQLINDLEYVTTALLFGGAKSAELSHASDNFGYLLSQHSTLSTITDSDRQRIAAQFRL